MPSADEQPDFVLLQKCRDPLNRPEYFPGSLTVLDLDDADFVDPKLVGIMEQVASRCNGAIAGSRFVARWLDQFCPSVVVVWTGSPLTNSTPKSRPSQRGSVVGWAVSDVLGYRAEAELV